MWDLFSFSNYYQSGSEHDMAATKPEINMSKTLPNIRHALLLCYFFSNSHTQICYAEIVGAFVLPHGGIALDPTYFNSTNQTCIKEAWAIHNAAVTVGESIANLNPDLMLLSTPHGIADLNNFVFYLNPRGFGAADTDNCDCPPCCYNVSIDMDSDIASRLVSELLGSNVSGLTAFGSTDDFPLK